MNGRGWGILVLVVGEHRGRPFASYGKYLEEPKIR